MEKYTLDELQIQKIPNVRLWELGLKSQITQEIAVTEQFQVYSNDQLHTIVSKVAINCKIHMRDISCIFVQGNKTFVPFSYQLNGVPLSNHNILDISVKYQSHNIQNIKDIGPLPVFINEISFLDRFRDDMDNITPYVQIRHSEIWEIFDISEPINIYFMNYSRIVKQFEHHNLAIKLPQFIQYQKYLFVYKYFPYQLESNFQIEEQFQLKQNDIQNELYQLQEIGFGNIEFKHGTQSISIQYQLQEHQVDLQQLFDNINMSNHQDIDYIQYLYILDTEQFFTQKAHNDIIRPHSQFYEDQINFYMKTGLICQINSQGYVQSRYKFKSSDIPSKIGKKPQDSQKDSIQEAKDIVSRYLYEFLQLLISQYTLSRQESIMNKQQYDEQSASYQMTSIVNVEGVVINQYTLNKITKQNGEVLQQQEGQENILITNLFLNSKSRILFIQANANGTVFEIQSQCTSFVKLLIPAIVILSRQIQETPQVIDINKSNRGYQQLLITDQRLFGNLKKGMNYSKSCKKEKQPIPTSNKDEKNTYTYHNITHNKKQLYKCPDKYPHFGFVVGNHAEDYCLPCCYDTLQNTPGKRQINDTCFNEYKYTDPSSKDSLINTYIYKSPNKLQVGRNTVLNDNIHNFINPQLQKNAGWFVFTLTLPNFMATVAERVKSLIDTCIYLLKIQNDQFQDKLSEFVQQNKYFQNQYAYLQSNQEYLMSIQQFEFMISQFIDFQYKLNVIYIHDHSDPREFMTNIQHQQEINSYQSNQTNIKQGNIIDIHVSTYNINNSKNILILNRKTIYNPIQLGRCEQTKEMVKQQHIVKVDIQIANNEIQHLLSKVEEQMATRRHNLINITKRLIDQYPSCKITGFIINQQGFVSYIEGSVNYKGSIVNLTLPVQPSIIDQQQKNKIKDKFTYIEGINKNPELMYEILLNIYKINPNYRVIDTQCSTPCLRGFVYDNLFFYSENYPINQKSIQQLTDIAIHPLVSFNPLFLNQHILEKKYRTLDKQTIQSSLSFIYFSNIYRLMKMQYSYYINNDPNALQSWEQIFEYTTIDNINQNIAKLASNKENKQDQNIQELVKLKVCQIQEEKQFFCNKQKLLVPIELKPYVQLLDRDIKRDLSIRANQVYQIMLQEFVFQNRKGDHLKSDRIQKY